MINSTEHFIHYTAIIDSPLGHLGIKLEDNTLTAVDFLSKRTPLVNPTNSAAKQAVKELTSYFNGRSKSFSIPINYKTGTPFQHAVWQALSNIPYGKTITYGTLAKQLKTHARAIGGACRNNRIPIIIPCHRVIGATHVGGYAGDTKGPLFSGKQWLLQHESGNT